MRVSGPLANTGTAPSNRSANARTNASACIASLVDLAQCVGYRTDMDCRLTDQARHNARTDRETKTFFWPTRYDSPTNIECPLRVIFRPRAASELGPFVPQQRTCRDGTGMSVSCQIQT